MVNFTIGRIYIWSNIQMAKFTIGLIHNWSNFELVEFIIGRIHNWSNFELVEFIIGQILNWSNIQLAKLAIRCTFKSQVMIWLNFHLVKHDPKLLRTIPSSKQEHKNCWVEKWDLTNSIPN